MRNDHRTPEIPQVCLSRHRPCDGIRQRRETWRGTDLVALLVACACLVSCSDTRLGCGTDEVMGTLSSMVRARALRIAADAYPPSFDAAKRAALTKATRVTPRDTKLVEWDTTVGRLACVARVVVEAPGPDADTNVRSEADLRYRVTRDNDDTFFVEVTYADLMTLFPDRSAPRPGTTPAR